MKRNITEEHILKILDLLYSEVVRSSGDGDALWYSRYYKIDDILPLLSEYNDTLTFPWNIERIDNSTVNWGKDQEGVTITNDKTLYDNAPPWQQMLLKL